MKNLAPIFWIAVFLVLLVNPLPAAGPVTRSFDADRDNDVDGNDLASFLKTAPVKHHLSSFASVFGTLLGEDGGILTPKAMVLKWALSTPNDCAAIGLSRIAIIARPVRLFTRFRAIQ